VQRGKQRQQPLEVLEPLNVRVRQFLLHDPRIMPRPPEKRNHILLLFRERRAEQDW